MPICVLLDEPEIHLHPLLQLNVLEYMRGLASTNQTQFIFTTHSPTLLDALEPDELFVLSPAPIAPDNQLSRLSDSFEKLEVARAITGATHVLTRGKPIVFVEGEAETSKIASDQRLMKMVVPGSEHWAVVPVGGRSHLRTVLARHANPLAGPLMGSGQPRGSWHMGPRCAYATDTASRKRKGCRGCSKCPRRIDVRQVQAQPVARAGRHG